MSLHPVTHLETTSDTEKQVQVAVQKTLGNKEIHTRHISLTGLL